MTDLLVLTPPEISEEVDLPTDDGNPGSWHLIKIPNDLTEANPGIAWCGEKLWRRGTWKDFSCRPCKKCIQERQKSEGST